MYLYSVPSRKPRLVPSTVATWCIGAAALFFSAILAPRSSGQEREVVQFGKSSFLTKVPAGMTQPPKFKPMGSASLKFPPTNQWYSSLVFDRFSRPHFPHPLAVHSAESGFRVAYPQVGANDRTIFGSMPAKTQDILATFASVGNWNEVKLQQASDWFVTARFQSGTATLQATYGHGGPMVFLRGEAGVLQLNFAAAPEVWSGGIEDSHLGVMINGNAYAIYGPTGTKWKGIDSSRWELESDSKKQYATIALLPEKNAKWVELFARYAHNHVVSTQISTTTDEATSKVITRFTAEFETLEGENLGTIFALYPHQWRNLKEPALLDGTYRSVRGEMKMVAGKSFEVALELPPMLPVLPAMEGEDNAKLLEQCMEIANAPETPDKEIYWEAKEIGRLANALSIAKQLKGGEKAAELIASKLKTMLEDWLTYTPNTNDTNFLVLDRTIGSVLAFPTGFGAVSEMNDHHFHYGYLVWGAAVLTEHDPQWGAEGAYREGINMLCRDYATPNRKDDTFPWLRAWDIYAGHGWASGVSAFEDGNNQESSSEAMLSLGALMLWGEVTKQKEWSRTGSLLLSHHLAAIENYWFDVNNENFPAAYKPQGAAMIWGGKSDFGTWFSGEPEFVYGINWLPVQGTSLYLGRHPEYVKRVLVDLEQRRGSDSWKDWGDLIEMVRALENAEQAHQRLLSRQPNQFEGGNSQANALHWSGALRQLGQLDRTIVSLYPFAATFIKNGQRTYVAYATKENVGGFATFSDGTRVGLTKQGINLLQK